MKVKITLICSIVLNLVLLGYWGVKYYDNSKEIKNYYSKRLGMNAICSNLKISDDMFGVMHKMFVFEPTIYVGDNQIYITFGSEKPDGIGIALIFNNKYQLTNKSCNKDWQPELKSFPIRE